MTNTANIHPNVPTDFNQQPTSPTIHPTAFVHHMAVVIGDVTLGAKVFVAPFACVRGDEGTPIFIADDSNIQDGVIIHALETAHQGHPLPQNLRQVQSQSYAVYIGSRVSLAHQCQIHGPSVIHDDTFIGMQALIFKSTVGRYCVVEPGAKIINVNIPDHCYVPTNLVLNNQQQADQLPKITPDYIFANLNADVVKVNTQLAQSYQKHFKTE